VASLPAAPASGKGAAWPAAGVPSTTAGSVLGRVGHP